MVVHLYQEESTGQWKHEATPLLATGTQKREAAKRNLRLDPEEICLIIFFCACVVGMVFFMFLIILQVRNADTPMPMEKHELTCDDSDAECFHDSIFCECGDDMWIWYMMEWAALSQY